MTGEHYIRWNHECVEPTQDLRAECDWKIGRIGNLNYFDIKAQLATGFLDRTEAQIATADNRRNSGETDSARRNLAQQLDKLFVGFLGKNRNSRDVMAGMSEAFCQTRCDRVDADNGNNGNGLRCSICRDRRRKALREDCVNAAFPQNCFGNTRKTINVSLSASNI